MKMTFVVPVHGRERLALVCLRQLRRTCDAARELGITAAAVVVGEGMLLERAAALGFGIVKRDNRQLGRKFNDGFQLACDPRYNPEPADYAIPCGSDDWVDPLILPLAATLPPDTIGIFRRIAIVDEDRARLLPLKVGYKGGAGVKFIPSSLLARAGYRPCDEDRNRGCDTSTLEGIKAATGSFPAIAELELHPLQIVDWKSSDGPQLNSYRALAGYGAAGEADPLEALAPHYPAEALEEVSNL